MSICESFTYYLLLSDLGYNGCRVAFQASYYSQLEGFLLSYHKDKSLLQTWLSCIILYGAHLLYFQAVSQDQDLLPLPNSLSFLQKEKTLCLGVFLTSKNNIFVGAFWGLPLLVSLSSPFILSSHIAPTYINILEHFLVLPKEFAELVSKSKIQNEGRQRNADRKAD